MRIVKWIGIVVVVLIVIVVSLPFLINVDQFRPTLQSSLSDALGRQVTLGNLRLKILTAEVAADDLSVADDAAFGKPAFLRAKSLQIGVELWPFLVSRKLIVTNLTLDEPEIEMVQAPSGDWNFSSLGGKSKTPSAPAAAPASGRLPLDLSVRLIKISNGRLTMRRTVGHWKPITLAQVNVEVRDFSAASQFPYAINAQVQGGGSIQLEGKAGPINPTDSAMTPVSVNLKVSKLDLAGSGMNDVAPYLTGLVSFDGSGDSNGEVMNLKGKLSAEELVLAKGGTPATRPVEVDFAVQHDLKKHSGTLRQGDIHIGAALAHLNGTYAEQGESMVVNLKFAGPNMPVQELEGMLPAVAVVLPAGTSLKGGTASANLSIDGPADRLVSTGTLSVNNTSLAGFDLSKKMGAIEKLAGIKASPDTEIQELSANLRSAPEGLAAQDMKLVVPSLGEVSGAGTVSPSNELNFKMSAMVHTSGVLAVAGNTPIPFTVEGTSSQPVFKPDIKAVATQQLKGFIGSDPKKAAAGILQGLPFGKKKN